MPLMQSIERKVFVKLFNLYFYTYAHAVLLAFHETKLFLCDFIEYLFINCACISFRFAV